MGWMKKVWHKANESAMVFTQNHGTFVAPSKSKLIFISIKKGRIIILPFFIFFI
jgi:hypothetical protein